MSRLVLEAAQVRKHIGDLFAAYPELSEDEDLRADTWEGETDLDAILTRIVRQRNEAEALVTAIAQMQANMQERRDRFERQAKAMKALALSLMQAAQVEKHVLPEATLSVGKGRASVEVTSIEDLPQGTFALERKADKKAILPLLLAGEDIPGARLAHSPATLTIRTK